MKIVWFYRTDVDKRAHITTWREIHRHISRNHEVFYLFPYSTEKTGFCETITFVETFRKPMLRRLSLVLNGFLKFVGLCRQVRPDIVILDQWSFFFSLPLILFRLSPVVVLDHRTPEFSQTTNTGGIRNALVRLWSRTALAFNRRYHDGATFISEELRNYLCRELSVRIHDRQHIWPSGVDCELFDPAKYDSPAVSKTIRLFFHGSLTNNRGLAELVSAIAILKRRGCLILLGILGDGPFREELIESVRSYQVDDCVDFIDPVEYTQVPQLIANSHICVMTYPRLQYWEANVPLKILEYMAMEKPIICTDLEVFKRITGGCHSAMLIKDNNPETIADGIEEAIAHYDELLRAVGHARHRVLREYSWEQIAAGLETFLIDLYKEKRHL